PRDRRWLRVVSSRVDRVPRTRRERLVDLQRVLRLVGRSVVVGRLRDATHRARHEREHRCRERKGQGLSRTTIHGSQLASEPSSLSALSASILAPSLPNPYCLTSCESRGRFIPRSTAARVMFPPDSESARAMHSRSI